MNEFTSKDAIQDAADDYREASNKLTEATTEEAKAQAKYDLALKSKLSLSKGAQVLAAKAEQLSTEAQHHTDMCLVAEEGKKGCEHIQGDGKSQIKADPFSPQSKATVAVANAKAAVGDAEAARNRFLKSLNALNVETNKVVTQKGLVQKAASKYNNLQFLFKEEQAASVQSQKAKRALQLVKTSAEVDMQRKVVVALESEVIRAQGELEEAKSARTTLVMETETERDSMESASDKERTKLDELSSLYEQAGLKSASCAATKLSLRRMNFNIVDTQQRIDSMNATLA